MRRFPDGALLRELLVAGRLEAGQLDRLARRLADFHDRAPAALPLSDFGAPERVEMSAVNVLARLHEHDGTQRAGRLLSWFERQAQVLRMAWLQRQRTGAVRECHGDLHLANIVLVDGELTPFDCAEFDPALRWIDVTSDVAFLTMDLKAHGRADLAFRFLDGYLQHSGDYAGVPQLRCYEVYRAGVRALVCSLRPPAGDSAGNPAGIDYLACAEQLSEQAGGSPRLLITHGPSGSGKSTVAGRLLAAAGAIRIRSDVERKRLFGLGALGHSSDRRAEIYSPEATRRTFERLLECARMALQAGYPVIVDAAFLRRAERQAFRALAARLQVPFAILDCRAGEAVLRHRVVARAAQGGDASEADLGVLERQFVFQEPLDASERAAHDRGGDRRSRCRTESLCDRWRCAGPLRSQAARSFPGP